MKKEMQSFLHVVQTNLGRKCELQTKTKSMREGTCLASVWATTLASRRTQLNKQELKELRRETILLIIVVTDYSTLFWSPPIASIQIFESPSTMIFWNFSVTANSRAHKMAKASAWTGSYNISSFLQAFTTIP